MLSLLEFRGLRLREFLEGEAITELADWEFLGRVWIGEAVGFTEWLRPANDPDHLGCLSLDLTQLPPLSTEAILQRLDLPLHRGMSLEQIASVLGGPLRKESFVANRGTYYFKVGAPDAYEISCTVLDDGGLTYLVVAPVGMGLA